MKLILHGGGVHIGDTGCTVEEFEKIEFGFTGPFQSAVTRIYEPDSPDGKPK